MNWLDLNAYGVELNSTFSDGRWLFTLNVIDDSKFPENEFHLLGFKAGPEHSYSAPITFDLANKLRELDESVLTSSKDILIDHKVLQYVVNHIGNRAAADRYFPSVHAQFETKEYSQLRELFSALPLSEESPSLQDINWSPDCFLNDPEKALAAAPDVLLVELASKLGVTYRARNLDRTQDDILAQENIHEAFADTVASYRTRGCWCYSKAELNAQLLKLSSKEEKDSFHNGHTSFSREREIHLKSVGEAIERGETVPRRVAAEHDHKKYVKDLDNQLFDLRQRFPDASDIPFRQEMIDNEKTLESAIRYSDVKIPKSATPKKRLASLELAQIHWEKRLDEDSLRYESLRLLGTDVCSSYDLLMGYGPESSLGLKRNHISYSKSMIEVISREIECLSVKEEKTNLPKILTILAPIHNEDPEYTNSQEAFAAALEGDTIYLTPNEGFSKETVTSTGGWADAESIDAMGLAKQAKEMSLNNYHHIFLLGPVDSRRRACRIFQPLGIKPIQPFVGLAIDEQSTEIFKTIASIQNREFTITPDGAFELTADGSEADLEL